MYDRFRVRKHHLEVPHGCDDLSACYMIPTGEEDQIVEARSMHLYAEANNWSALDRRFVQVNQIDGVFYTPHPSTTEVVHRLLSGQAAIVNELIPALT